MDFSVPAVDRHHQIPLFCTRYQFSDREMVLVASFIFLFSCRFNLDVLCSYNVGMKKEIVSYKRKTFVRYYGFNRMLLNLHWSHFIE